MSAPVTVADRALVDRVLDLGGMTRGELAQLIADDFAARMSAQRVRRLHCTLHEIRGVIALPDEVLAIIERELGDEEAGP